MRQHPVVRCGLIALWAGAAASASGQTFIWTGAVNSNWDTTTLNWIGGGPVWENSATSVALFQGPGRLIDIVEDITLNEVVVESFGWTFREDGGEVTLAGPNPGISVDSGSSVSFSVPMHGSAGFAKSGPGLLILDMLSDYTGQTTLADGTIRVIEAGFPIYTNLHIDGAASLHLFRLVTYQYGALTGAGSIVSPSGAGPDVDVQGSLAGSTFGGHIGGSSDPGIRVVKSGTGTQTLTNSSSNYPRGTGIQAGTLIAGASNALGTGSVDVSAGGTLGVQGNSSFFNSVTITGAGAAGRAGAIDNVSDSNTLAGQITLGAGSGHTIGASSGTLNISQDILNPSGHALTFHAASGATIHTQSVNSPMSINKTGQGVLQLNGPSLSSDPANLQQGVIVFGHPGALSGSIVTMATGSSNTLRLNGQTAIVRGLAGGDSLSFVDNAGSGTPATLMVDGAETTTFGGLIWNGPASAGLGLTKDGGGTLVLTGSHGYTGATRINAGVLTAHGALASPVTMFGGRLDGNGSLGSTVTMSAGDLEGSRTIAGLLTMTGGRLRPAGTGQGTMTLNGGLDASGGTIEIQGPIPLISYDQLHCLGNVSLGSGVTTLNFTTGGTPVYGPAARIPLIRNNGAGSTTGHFVGLPPGDVMGPLTGFGGQPRWYMHYNADTGTGALSGGNDVVLAPQPGSLFGNGSFEDGVDGLILLPQHSSNIDYWLAVNGSIDWETAWVAADGVRSVDLQGFNAAGGVRQDVVLQGRTWYRLRFALAGNPNGGPIIKHMTARAGDVTRPFEFDTTGRFNGDMGWEEHSIQFFVNAGGPVEISFVSTDPLGHFGAAIDHVRLDAFPCGGDLSSSADPNDPFYGVPDGTVDSSDFFYFLDQFVGANLVVADLTGSADPNDPAYGIPDGFVDASDFFYFLDLFVLGCG